MFDPLPLLTLKVPNVSFVPCSLLWVHLIQWLFPYLCPKLQQSILTSIFLNDVLPHGHHSCFVFSSTGLIMELPCFMICRSKVLSPIHVDKFLHWTPYNCLISLTTLQIIYPSTLLDFSFPCMNCCFIYFLTLFQNPCLGNDVTHGGLNILTLTHLVNTMPHTHRPTQC